MPLTLLQQAILCSKLHQHCNNHIDDQIRHAVIDIHMRAMRLFEAAGTDEAAEDAVAVIQQCRLCLKVLAETA